MSRIITFREALTAGMAHEMRRDPSVFVYGIDAADHKRAFKSHDGLVEEFGPERCFSTPLSEDAMTGLGLGAAIRGMRPVQVHLRVDFMLLAMNQLVNMVSCFHYGAAGRVKVPFLVRAIIGRGWGQAFQHSKALHAWLAHVPGLTVILPATAQDAMGMTMAAIRGDNPVISLEHRWLYDTRGEVPDPPQPVPLTGCAVRRAGQDITVLATSWMNLAALRAAELLAAKGIGVEVVDARCIAPFDDTLLLASVEKTRRCLVVDNDWVHCGFAAEVAARVSEHCFGRLLAPVRRMGFAPVPCPCSPPLEEAFYPDAPRIAQTIESMLGA